jgi:TonB family protein
MKKVQLITIALFSSFAYGQNTGIFNVNYTNGDKNKLAINQELPYSIEGKLNNESKKTFYPSGKIKSEINFKYKKENLSYKTYINWYESGQIKSVINYINDIYDGSLTTFWENGNPKRQDIYKMGKLVEGKCFDEDGNETEYFKYEIFPEFKGGVNSLYSFINKELKYPEEALDNNYTGKVIVYLTINESGKITFTEIIKGNAECLNSEALRIVRNMPEWNPGKLDGEIVVMQIGIPISFYLAN